MRRVTRVTLLWAAAYSLLGLGLLALRLGAWRLAFVMLIASMLAGYPAAVVHWIYCLREIVRELRALRRSPGRPDRTERKRNGRR